MADAVLDRGGSAPSITLAHPRAIRTQRPRKRGYRTPQGAVYIGRPTFWANPFDADRFGHARSVLLYRRWLACELGARSLEHLGFCPAEIDALGRWRVRIDQRLPDLRGKALQCWCPQTSRWCHGDALVTLVNGGLV